MNRSITNSQSMQAEKLNAIMILSRYNFMFGNYDFCDYLKTLPGINFQGVVLQRKNTQTKNRLPIFYSIILFFEKLILQKFKINHWNINRTIKELSKIFPEAKFYNSIYQFEEDEISTPDIILDFSLYRSRTNTINTKYGTLFLQYTEISKEHIYKLGFWELVTKQGEIFGSINYTNNQKRFSVRETYSYVDKYSAYKTLKNHYWKLLSLYKIELQSFHSNNRTFHELANTKENFGAKFKKNECGIVKTLLFYSHNIINKVSSKLKKESNKWVILSKKFETAEDLFNLNFNSFKVLSGSQNKDWADPFVITTQNKNILFFEETSEKTGKGHLSRLELMESTMEYENYDKILNTNYHLSFPFVFDIGSNYYMIPESAANKTVDLYKAREFPNKWEHIKTIFSGIRANDTVVYRYNSTWWMFTCIADDKMHWNYDNLYLFYADDIMGEWTPHPKNPVVSDVKSARCAGKIINLNNKLFRPSQNCKYRYGYGLNIAEIIVLNKTEYKEKIVKCYYPTETEYNSIHTLNISDNLIVSDAKK